MVALPGGGGGDDDAQQQQEQQQHLQPRERKRSGGGVRVHWPRSRKRTIGGSRKGSTCDQTTPSPQAKTSYGPFRKVTISSTTGKIRSSKRIKDAESAITQQHHSPRTMAEAFWNRIKSSLGANNKTVQQQHNHNDDPVKEDETADVIAEVLAVGDVINTAEYHQDNDYQNGHHVNGHQNGDENKPHRNGNNDNNINLVNDNNINLANSDTSENDSPFVEGSKILTESDVSRLEPFLPPRLTALEWIRVFSTEDDGFTLANLYRKMANMDPDRHCVLVVKDEDGYRFGALVSATLRNAGKLMYGGGESLLFRLRPDFKVWKWEKDEKKVSYVYGNMQSINVGISEGHFGLSLDNALYHGRSQVCRTYNNEPLNPNGDFKVVTVEVWAFE